VTGRKRHLMVTVHRAACGVVDPPITTNDPARVTCGSCMRTVAMADAEVRKSPKVRPIK